MNYNILLDFQEIRLDLQNQAAVVILDEGHDVIFEVSNPVVSSLRGIKHNIKLHKEGEEWKIIDDQYEDEVWRLIFESKKTKEEIFSWIDTAKIEQLQQEAIASQYVEPPITTARLPYNRTAAANYALKYAHSPNPDYFSWYDYGGDCTNFVSQALHDDEGAKIPMAFGKNRGPRGDGWYMFNINDFSNPWVVVDDFYNFVVRDRNVWSVGPEGIDTYRNALEIGDIVQFMWVDTTYWAHSVIVTKKQDTTTPGVFTYLISAHDDNRMDYPLNSIVYKDIRYIHIIGSDPIETYMPLIKSPGYSSNPRSISDNGVIGSLNEAYPIPVSTPTVAPYPAP